MSSVTQMFWHGSYSVPGIKLVQNTPAFEIEIDIIYQIMQVKSCETT